MTAGWVEVGEGVSVWRHPVLDVNATLITGEGESLLIDTLSTPRQARRLGVTPSQVVNTHHHFDHCFGNQVYAGCRIWAHRETERVLVERPGEVMAEALREFGEEHPERGDLTEVQIVPPTDIVGDQATLDVGGRRVELRHVGPGHTAGDLIVIVPDARVAIAGDLVEEGAPVQFSDAYPLDWPHALAELLHLMAQTGGAWRIVPGHGAVVDEAFVRRQHDELAALAWLIREGHAAGFPPQEVAARSPLGPGPSLEAVRRGYAQLDGRL